MVTTARSQRGINIVELLITISILTLTLSIGVPSFHDIKRNADRSAAMIELVSAVRLARSEAALRGTSMSVCPSTDGTSCSGGDDWSHGWIVFRDGNADLAIADQTDVLRVVRFDHPRFSLTADDDLGAGITFGTFGFATPSAGVLVYADDAESREIELSYVGRLNVTEAAEPIL